MFGFLKRKTKNRKVEPWETSLLKNVIKKLPDEYSHLADQVDAGLLARALIGYATGFDDNVTLTYNPDKSGKFEDRKSAAYNLIGITVLKADGKRAPFSIFVADGLISGYTLEGLGQTIPGSENIDVSEFAKKLKINPDYIELEKVLSAKEKKAVNESHVYTVTLEDKVYYHLEDLEDGDFIGMDLQKNVYHITHDPYEIIRLEGSIPDILAAARG